MTPTNGNSIALENNRVENEKNPADEREIDPNISTSDLDRTVRWQRKRGNRLGGRLSGPAEDSPAPESDFDPESLGGWPDKLDQSLQITQARAREQEAYNERTRYLLRQQVEGDALQREYTRDVQWLERSDAAGRCEYHLEKNRKSVISRLSNFLVLQVTLRNSTAFAQRTTELRAAVLALSDATRDLERAREAAHSERKKIQTEADRLHARKVLQQRAMVFFWDLVQVAWAAAAAFMIVQLAGEVLSTGPFDLERILLWSVGFTICGWESGLSLEKRRSVSRQIRAIVRPGIPYLAPNSHIRIYNDLEDERTARLNSAARAYGALKSDWESVVCETLDLTLANGSFLEEFKNCIGEHQKSFPRLLRVDWDAIDPELLEQQITEVSKTVIEPTLNKRFTPAFLLDAFKKSDDLRWQADLDANQHLLEEVFRSDHLSTPLHLRLVGESAGETSARR